MNPRLHTGTHLALAAAGLLFCLPAAAGPGPDPALEQEVAQLRQALHALEARVRQLEQALRAEAAAGQDTRSTPAAAPPVSSPAATSAPAPVSPLDPALQTLGRLRDAWERITADMNPAQVREQLGEPVRRFVIDGKPVWYYSYPGVGNGSVMFSADGEIVGKQKPPFGFR
jgi:hypothetical protein